MKTIITYGTFDLFHVGHVRLFRRLKELGDYLIVACSTDEFNAIKGKTTVIEYCRRVEMLESCRYIDKVIPETNWEQKVADCINYKVDIFAMGDDWSGKFDYLKKICSVIYLPRTDGISTSEIKSSLKLLEKQ